MQKNNLDRRFDLGRPPNEHLKRTCYPNELNELRQTLTRTTRPADPGLGRVDPYLRYFLQPFLKSKI